MMAGLDSRYSAKRLASRWHGCRSARRPAVILATLAIWLSPEVWAWNPYDTDSSWSASGPTSDFSAAGDYRAPAQPRDDTYGPRSASQHWSPGWGESSRRYRPEEEAESWSNAGSAQDLGWGSSRSWASQDSPRRWSQPDWSPERATPAPDQRYSDQWQDPRQHSAPTWRFADDQPYLDSSADVGGGYEFRHDPSLDVQQGAQTGGWEFRPLSDRDQYRALADDVYPRIDERDYLPRGPWRSYQDEGAAFGYHADDRWPSHSAQPR